MCIIPPRVFRLTKGGSTSTKMMRSLHGWSLIQVFICGLCLLPMTRQAQTRRANDSPPDADPGPTTAPVPYLSAEEEIATMHLPPGFEMQVVACEPMVEHPVAMAFDAQGRM